jgi:hypothetical protein
LAKPAVNLADVTALLRDMDQRPLCRQLTEPVTLFFTVD